MSKIKIEAIASAMPGTDAWTLAVFSAKDVPVGTVVVPVQAQEPVEELFAEKLAREMKEGTAVFVSPEVAPVQAQEPFAWYVETEGVWGQERFTQIDPGNTYARVTPLYTTPVQPVAVPTAEEYAAVFASEALDQVIMERDYNAEMADKLADGIAEHFGTDIGEHSSANCPWAQALDLLNTKPEFIECAGSKHAAPAAQGAGASFARQLIDSGAKNYIGEVFDTERGDIEVMARYVHGKTPADKLAELDRDSPADQPNMMLVTVDELRTITIATIATKEKS